MGVAQFDHAAPGLLTQGNHTTADLARQRLLKLLVRGQRGCRHRHFDLGRRHSLHRDGRCGHGSGYRFFESLVAKEQDQSRGHRSRRNAPHA